MREQIMVTLCVVDWAGVGVVILRTSGKGKLWTFPGSESRTKNETLNVSDYTYHHQGRCNI